MIWILVAVGSSIYQVLSCDCRPCFKLQGVLKFVILFLDDDVCITAGKQGVFYVMNASNLTAVCDQKLVKDVIVYRSSSRVFRQAFVVFRLVKLGYAVVFLIIFTFFYLTFRIISI